MSALPPFASSSRYSEPQALDIPLEAGGAHSIPDEKGSSNRSEQELVARAQTFSDFPDGGLQAWLQVIGSFFLVFVAWGTFNTFGAFQTYYEEELLVGTSASTISWIGSIDGFMVMIFGTLSGPIFDKGHFRALIAIGSFFTVFGLMMTSLSTSFYQIFWAVRALAVGIALCGSSLAGIIYPAIFRQLQPQIGFPWTVRVIGFVTLGVLAFSLAVMRPRFTSRTSRALLDPSAFTDAPYMLFCVGNFLSFMGAYIPYFYITAFAQAHTGANTSLSFYTIAILNGVSVIGRIIPNFIADNVGPLNIITPCAMVTAILAFCWIPADSVGGLIVFICLYALSSGALLSLTPASIGSLTQDIGRVGTRLGMSLGMASFGLLIGNPVAGALVNLRAGSFVHAQIYNGAIVIGAGIFMALARVSKVGWSLRVKA
ncbi:unnamed protein product [Peniophora sp. CBMAI 1063]|nr:unnamed protein product [Peniophora sp. CBMAI 1063]